MVLHLKQCNKSESNHPRIFLHLRPVAFALGHAVIVHGYRHQTSLLNEGFESELDRMQNITLQQLCSLTLS